MPKEEKSRRRVVVEEVGASDETTVDQSAISEPVEEIKEKVTELQDITKDLSESVAKSEDVQEDLAKAVEEVAPSQAEPPKSESPQEPNSPIQQGNGTNPLFVIVPGIFLLGALLGGIYFYQKGTVGGPKPSPTPTETTESTPMPSTTPSSTLDLSKYPINIMNGSGTAGEAGKVKTLLTGGSFSVSATGNASSYGFTKTVIKAKVDVPAAFVTQLSTLLSKSYVLDTNQTLATSSADEVQVIVGSTKAQ